MKYIIKYLIFIAIIYGLVAFYSMNLNPLQWAKGERLFFCLVIGIAAVLLVLVDRFANSMGKHIITGLKSKDDDNLTFGERMAQMIGKQDKFKNL